MDSINSLGWKISDLREHMVVRHQAQGCSLIIDREANNGCVNLSGRLCTQGTQKRLTG
jgi:hypothetical protein